MAGFTEAMLFKKLEDLNESQQSIEKLSLWLIHHRKHYQLIVKSWMKEMAKAGNEVRKLTLMYLANDVIQNSRRKGPEFGKEFSLVLKKAFTTISNVKLNGNTVKKLQRLLNVWQERNIYEESAIDKYRACLTGKEDSPIPPESPPEKKTRYSSRREDSPIPPDSPPEKRPRYSSGGDKHEGRTRKISEVEVDGHHEVHVTLSPYSPPRDPPEPEELIKALMDLENAPSVDAAVREKISKLPPEVSELKLLDKITDKEAAAELAERVNEAVDILQDYNTRLAQEMEERKKVLQMLNDFTLSQKELMAQAQQRIEEYREKLTKVELVKHEVSSHINNLPKLPNLPDVTGGLTPLPSAGDLFT